MYCSKCGSKINDNASFCSQCGAALTANSINNSYGNITGNQSVIYAIIALVFVFIAITFLFLLDFRNNNLELLPFFFGVISFVFSLIAISKGKKERRKSPSGSSAGFVIGIITLIIIVIGIGAILAAG